MSHYAVIAGYRWRVKGEHWQSLLVNFAHHYLGYIYRNLYKVIYITGALKARTFYNYDTPCRCSCKVLLSYVL